MRKRIAAMALLLLCAFCLLAGGSKNVACAQPSEDAFSGDIRMLKQDEDRYVMQVTVENKGEDFSGTVQTIFSGTGVGNTACNVEMTLPAQGKKQYTITITERTADTIRGLCTLNFLDEDGNLLQTISLKNVFGKTAGISVGILSDHYSGLTYLDAGGMDFSIQQLYAPLTLVELNRDNLKSLLDGLYFLVIDEFNVSSLEEDSIQAIQEWVKSGGWLLVGTGEYAEQTLSGFDKDFLNVEVLSVSQPGTENIASENAERYGYYGSYLGQDVDFTRMAVAELYGDKKNGMFYESPENPALCGTVEEGAVSIFYVSLGEDELQKLTTYEVQYMLEETMYRSGSYRTYGGYSEMDYAGQKALAFIDHQNTGMDFTLLEVLIGVYVILAGTVLYLILRKCKKSEWYWIGAPVLGLGFIAGVFFLGQGAGVNETRVYSVTAQQTDGSRKDTYFLAYHSGLDPWEVLLDESYDVAGPGWTWYNRRYNTNLVDYSFIVSDHGDRLSMGIKPQENFENGFLHAGGNAVSRGNISVSGLSGSGVGGNFSGTVTNETDLDMAYLAVWFNSYLRVFSDVKAGETIDLMQAAKDGRCVYENSQELFEDNVLYRMLSLYGTPSNVRYEEDTMAALIIGLGLAAEHQPPLGNYAVLTGVVKDYDRAVSDKCSEMAYGCFYSYADIGGEPNAAN